MRFPLSCWLLGLALLTPALGAAAQAPGGEAGAAAGTEGVAPAGEDVRQRVERLYRNPRYQASYPGEGEPEREPVDPPTGGPLLALLAELMLWAALAAGVALVLYLVYDLLRSRGRARAALAAGVALVLYLVYDLLRSRGRARAAPRESPVRPAPPPSAEPEPRPQVLPDPEALAAEGRFGEAVHALLLHAVPLLDGRRRRPWPPGTTGRGMAATVDLEGAPRRALALLVAAVEHFLFARRPLTEEDWLVCRGAFQDLRGGVAETAVVGAGTADAVPGGEGAP